MEKRSGKPDLTGIGPYNQNLTEDDLEHLRPKSFRQQFADSLALQVLAGAAVIGLIIGVIQSLF